MEVSLYPICCPLRTACMKLRLVSEGEWDGNWWQEETETCWRGQKNACTLIEGTISETSRFRQKDAEVTFAAFRIQTSPMPNDPFIPFFILQISLQSIFGGRRGNDIDESRFQRCSSHQEPIDVFDLNELIAVLFSDAASVDDAAVSGLRADFVEIFADPAVDFVNLLCGGSFAGSDRPDRLVREDDVGPVALSDVLDSVQLTFDHFDGPAFFPFQQGLSEAENHLQFVLQGSLHLLPDHLVTLPKMGPPFRVPQNDPSDIHVNQLLCRNFSRKGAIAMRRAILSCNLNILIGLEEGDSNKMQVDRRNHHFYLIWIELQLIEQ